MLSVCAEPGCPAIQTQPRCLAHRRKRERERGSRQQRGYGADHDTLRARWAPLVAMGRVKCWRCSEFIGDNETWHLGHDDHNRSLYRGPECVPCNTATSGR